MAVLRPTVRKLRSWFPSASLRTDLNGQISQKNEPLSPFQRFEELTKRLLAVPRKELQAKLDKYSRKKAKSKAG
jgi:hypothetical protein